MADIACMYYFEIPQEENNENTIITFHYLTEHTISIPYVVQIAGLINAHLYD